VILVRTESEWGRMEKDSAEGTWWGFQTEVETWGWSVQGRGPSDMTGVPLVTLLWVFMTSSGTWRSEESFMFCWMVDSRQMGCVEKLVPCCIWVLVTRCNW
jgi:hypothetical protein